jgi:hypothetical protein
MPTSCSGSVALLLLCLSVREVERNRGSGENARQRHEAPRSEPPVEPGSSHGKRDDDDDELNAEMREAQDIAESPRRHDLTAPRLRFGPAIRAQTQERQLLARSHSARELEASGALVKNQVGRACIRHGRRRSVFIVGPPPSSQRARRCSSDATAPRWSAAGGRRVPPAPLPVTAARGSRDYRFATIASPNSEHLRSFAPFMSRSRS